MHALRAQIGAETVQIADFDRLPTRCQFIAFMPQWDFLDFLADQGARYPTFKLDMQTEVTGLIEEGGSVVGVRAKTPSARDGAPRRSGRRGATDATPPCAPRADLAGTGVRGADGRAVVQDLAAAGRPGDSMGRFEAGQIFVLIARGEHWQCGYVIPKGTVERLQREGLPAFRDRVASSSRSSAIGRARSASGTT